VLVLPTLWTYDGIGHATPTHGAELAAASAACAREHHHRPVFLLPDLVSHLDEFTAPGAGSLIFTGPKGAPSRRSDFTRARRKATASAGLVDIRDLRHTGNTMAGSSLRELMDRMGHSNTRAALIYQHRTAQRDR
jgi:integrase